MRAGIALRWAPDAIISPFGEAEQRTSLSNKGCACAYSTLHEIPATLTRALGFRGDTTLLAYRGTKDSHVSQYGQGHDPSKAS